MHSWLLAITLLSTLSAGRPTTRPVLEDDTYGETVLQHDGVTVWWCDATRKVSLTRPAPAERRNAMRLSAARNEFEAVQLVIRPDRDLRGLHADARGSGGAAIPADSLQIFRVGYVPVTTPTDKLATAGDWPDPLPPLTSAIDLPAGRNQPLWVLIRVPKDATAGDYAGDIQLTADGGWSASVPLQLHIWDFALPDTPRTHSAFGFSPELMARYHRLKTEADKRAVFHKYMRDFADHRISPYNPTPYDAMAIRFVPDADPPRAEVDFERFDAAMQRAIDEYHITSFQLRLPGMGGGTFHSRHEGEIAGFKAGTPQYEAMFASAAGQIEAHLREKGWLDKAFIYWFDEPEPRDYDFVRAGMERIRRHAPKLRRMLTEEPVPQLMDAVDLWCPITPSYNHDAAEKVRTAGGHFWWYVCTGPKGPFCTLFTDHPATDLRAWLWQTWQRKIEGILVWQSNYWTSSAAFPDSLQDPYADPMSYVSGYSTPAGEKKHWGNGDGRFLYPPQAARPGRGDQPVLDEPVSSIRWEMLREGIEDVDYLYILRDAIGAGKGDAELRKAAEKLLEVPAAITSSMTSYTFDSAPIYAHRQAVAEMIERLEGRRKE